MSLHVLGLTEQETRAYVALSRVLLAASARLGAELGTTTDAAAVIAEQLVDRALAVRRPGGVYVAVRPAIALGALSAQVRRELEDAEVTLVELEDAFRAARPVALPDVLIDIVRGRDEVRERLRQIQLQAQREVLSLVKAPVSVVASDDDDAEDLAAARGVQYRVVLDRAMLAAEPRLLEEIHRVRRAAGEQVRIAADVPTKLFIVDREVALVPLGVGNDPSESAIVLGAGGVLDALVALFEAVWEGAQDVDGGASAPGREDARLLTMLLAGYTDDAAARDLGISSRTLQRRVRSLLDLAGVDTRLQLGYVIAQRGWAGTDLRR